jgi:hypothetical protein
MVVNMDELDINPPGGRGAEVQTAGMEDPARPAGAVRGQSQERDGVPAHEREEVSRHLRASADERKE